MSFRKFLPISLMAGAFVGTASAQSVNQDERADQVQINTITTAVPFLMIGPDAHAGGMAEVGAATPANGSSIHWNPAKMAFLDNKMGFAVSYTPWLRALVPDINLAYISGYGKIGKKGQQTLAGSLRYFSLGEITFTDNVGNVIGNFTPNEFALDVAYARQLSKEFSGGIALRYIYSNLTGGISVGGATTRPGMAGAADISFYYRTQRVEIAKKKTEISAGIVFSNLGSKMSYTQNNEEDFIPMNFRFGVGFRMWFDDHNSLGVYYDLNKLLVPTPPQYDRNAQIVVDGDTIDNPNYGQITAGKDPNVSVPAAIFQSFADAPGGSAEEWKEVNHSIALEYWYQKLFSVRAGYFHEDVTKGNRQFFTIGAGIRYNVFGIDFAYLIPTQQNHPLQNTLRFTLTFDFANLKKKDKTKDDGKPEE
jgi:hypothetical protein